MRTGGVSWAGVVDGPRACFIADPRNLVVASGAAANALYAADAACVPLSWPGYQRATIRMGGHAKRGEGSFERT